MRDGDLKVKSRDAIQAPKTMKAEGRKISKKILVFDRLYTFTLLMNTADRLFQNPVLSLSSDRLNLLKLASSTEPSVDGLPFSRSCGSSPPLAVLALRDIPGVRFFDCLLEGSEEFSCSMITGSSLGVRLLIETSLC